MHCHLCQREAVDRCYTCGELFCEEHGNVNCVRCTTGIIAGDNRADRITSNFAREAFTAGVVAAARSRGLHAARLPRVPGASPLCVRQLWPAYCREHAGKDGLCLSCQRALRGSNVFLALLVLGMVGLVVLGLLRGWVSTLAGAG